jgi:hypothetical protein
MPNPNRIVSLSEQAFFTVVSSALEAFQINHNAQSNKKHIPLETYGNLWGHTAQKSRGESILYVSLVDVETSAKRTPGSVQAANGSFELKQQFVERFHPEIEYLGDFHSHPYDPVNDKVKNALKVERKKFYEFSPADFEAARSLCDERGYRLGLVVTVFRSDTPIKRRSKHVGLSCIRFSYDGFIIWLKCHVFEGDRAVQNRKVALICPSLGFHIGAVKSE